MRLQRIYSSKLYLTSSRKDKIHAAINDPDVLNVELVKQLEDYLDDDAKAVLHTAEAKAEAEQAQATAEAGGGVAPSNSSSPSAPSLGGGGGGAPAASFTGDIDADFGDDELADVELPEDEVPNDDVPNDEPADEVVESVTQEGKPITATCKIWTTLDDVVSDCDTIKGTLNAREDTAGVIRLEVKESELWVYYNDDSNLNDKMIEVISVLNSTGYTYLKFNRLARSNNAIVFDISLNALDPVKPESELDDKK